MVRLALGTCAMLLGVCPALAGTAGTPLYVDFQLQARANFSGAFNFPDSAFFTNNTAALNDGGAAAIYVSVIAGANYKAIWLGSGGSGQIIYTSPEGAGLSDVCVNNSGRIVFPQSFTSPAGIIRYDAATGETAVAVGPGGPFGLTGWGGVCINNAGQIAFRGTVAFTGQAWISVDGSSQARHAAEVTVDPQSPHSFLFTPAFNNVRQIAGKVRLGAASQVGGERPDQIRVFAADGSSVLIAEDRDSNPASPYAGFDNSVSLNDAGWVAFIANRVAGGRGVYVSSGASTVEIASSSGGIVSDIEPFGPKLNNAGWVAFRALDAAGRRAVWVGNGSWLVRVIGEHDLIPTDLGLARIDEHLAGNPVFGGGLDINDNGDVSFQANLTPPDDDQVEWGSGVFVARAALAGDLNCDGAVNAFDIDPFVLAVSSGAGYELYYAVFPDCHHLLADVNHDGAVNAFDIDPFVQLIVGD